MKYTIGVKVTYYYSVEAENEDEAIIKVRRLHYDKTIDDNKKTIVQKDTSPSINWEVILEE